MPNKHQHPFAWCKDQIKAHPEFTAAERCSLVAIADAWDPAHSYVWLSNEQIAERWSIRLGTFRKHVAKFQRLGLIARKQGRSRHGGFGRARISLLVTDRGSPESAAVNATAAPREEPHRGSSGGATDVPPGVPASQDPLAPLVDLGADAPDAQPVTVTEAEAVLLPEERKVLERALSELPDAVCDGWCSSWEAVAWLDAWCAKNHDDEFIAGELWPHFAMHTGFEFEAQCYESLSREASNAGL